MPKIVAVTDGTMALPIALTGVVVHEVKSAKDAEAIIEQHLQDDTEILIIQDTVRRSFSEWFGVRIARHRGKPLLVSCPSFEQEESNVDAYLNSILKPAIGYEIRLE